MLGSGFPLISEPFPTGGLGLNPHPVESMEADMDSLRTVFERSFNLTNESLEKFDVRLKALEARQWRTKPSQ